MKTILGLGSTLLLASVTCGEASDGFKVLGTIHLPSLPTFSRLPSLDDVLKDIGLSLDSLFSSGNPKKIEVSNPVKDYTSLDKSLNEMHQLKLDALDQRLEKLDVKDLNQVLNDMNNENNQVIDNAIKLNDLPSKKESDAELGNVVKDKEASGTFNDPVVPNDVLSELTVPTIKLDSDSETMGFFGSILNDIFGELAGSKSDDTNSKLNDSDSWFGGYFDNMVEGISDCMGDVSTSVKTSINDFTQQLQHVFPNSPVHVEIIDLTRSPDYIPEVCLQPALTFCQSKIYNGEYQARMCLLDNMIQLSPDCMKYMMDHSTLADRCYFDIDANCKPVRWSLELTGDCLQKNIDEVAKTCSRFVEKMFGKTASKTSYLSIHQSSVSDGVWKPTDEVVSAPQSLKSEADTTESKSSTVLIVLGIVGGGLVVAFAIGYVVLKKRKVSRRSFYIDATTCKEQSQPILSYDPENEELV